MAAAHGECPLFTPSNRDQNVAQHAPKPPRHGKALRAHKLNPQHSHPRTPVHGSPVANGSPKISPAKIQPASRERPTQSTQRLSGGPHTRSLTVAAPLSCSRFVLVLDAPTQRQPAFPFAASRLRVSPTARPASLQQQATSSKSQRAALGLESTSGGKISHPRTPVRGSPVGPPFSDQTHTSTQHSQRTRTMPGLESPNYIWGSLFRVRSWFKQPPRKLTDA